MGVGVTERTRHVLRVVWLRHWALLLFLVFALLATATSKDVRQSINIQLPLLAGLFLYILLVDAINTPKKLRVVMAFFSLVMIVLVLVSLRNLLLVVADKPLEAVRTLDSFLLVVPNDVLVLAVVMPLLFGTAWAGASWLRMLYACFFLVTLAIAEKLQSRQALALLLGGQLLVVAMMRPRWAVPVALLLLTLGALLDGLSGWRLAQKIFLFPRTYVWHTAWVMFLDCPWTGQGPGLFGDIYLAFLVKAGYVLEMLPDRRPMLWAHNLYLEQLAERGIGGLLSLLSLLSASAFYAWRTWRQVRNTAVSSLAAGIFTAMTVLMTAGIAEASLSRLWVAVSLMVLAAFAVVADNFRQPCRFTGASAPAATASGAQE